MEVIILETPDEIARASAAIIADEIRAARERGRRNPVIGVSTGSSPVGTYSELARMVRSGDLVTDDVVAFALDEYVGLDEDHPESYHAVIHRTVTDPLRLSRSRVHIPDGLADDIPAACDAYERMITAAGGIDIQLLGVGTNGHIGFNEPGSPLDSRTRASVLTEGTREDNSRFFSSVDEVPLLSVTQGIGTILDARRLLLVARGEAKAEAVAQLVEGPVSPECPASALQLHPDAIIMIDPDAASLLSAAHRSGRDHAAAEPRMVISG